MAVTDLACTVDRSPEAVSGHESPARDFASGDCAAGRTCVETGWVFVRSATLCADIWRRDLERHGAATVARVQPIFFCRRQRWTSRGIRKFHRQTLRLQEPASIVRSVRLLDGDTAKAVSDKDDRSIFSTFFLSHNRIQSRQEFRCAVYFTSFHLWSSALIERHDAGIWNFCRGIF